MRLIINIVYVAFLDFFISDNRYIFEGVNVKDGSVNELYVGHRYVNLSTDGYTSPMEQLYRLFVEYGVDNTFAYLSTVAKLRADMFLLHKSLYNKTCDVSNIADKVQESIAEDISMYTQKRPDISLDCIVSGATYDLLTGMSGYLKKKY